MNKKYMIFFAFIFLNSCNPWGVTSDRSINENHSTIGTFTSTFTVSKSFTPLPGITSDFRLSSKTPSPITTTPTFQIVFKPENFAFPVAFNGPYALKNPLVYSPCYHWDPTKYDQKKVTSNNWSNFFHAGDLFELNLTSIVKDIVVLSPVNGTIEKVSVIPNNGLEINIRTDYFLDGKRIFVDLVHSTVLFPGDEQNPRITTDSIVKLGQPIAIQKKIFQLGRPEQVIDIGIRNGQRGANPSIPGNFYPDSYLDPYDYLVDEIPDLLGKSVFYDNGFRAHCLKSGHYKNR
jgi:hypothetical protein